MKNRITEILGSEYPIIQGAMRLITLGDMAAASSRAGAFGIIAASGLEGDRLRAEIRKARSLTSKPFGINIPIYRPNAWKPWRSRLRKESRLLLPQPETREK